eukprot:TRINITY_DN1949_c0_g1_i2.p1 TRINITY_DN1949_c0_g1~~TRINITY_DN1949_c0_g1_i2.p1  ORF type:complete len:469 (+),score=89.79 TRINITY_DN1949_c0_g1_i2:103-1509(+)
MKIILVTVGTKCDFYPTLVFGVALKKYTQHEVTFLTNEIFQDTVERHGMRFAKIRVDVSLVSKSPEVKQVLADGNSNKVIQTLAPVINKMFEDGRQDTLQECRGKDLIICCISSLTHCFTISEKLKTPLIILTTAPITPTEQHPHFIFPRVKRTKKQNLDTYRQFIQMFDTPERKRQYNQWREELGLKAFDIGPHALLYTADVPTICLFSAYSLGGRPSDWKPNVHVTGFPTNAPLNLFDEEEQVDEDLEQFLSESEEPPILFAFGGSPFPDPTQQVLMAAKVVNRLNKRAIIGLFPFGVFPCAPILECRSSDLPPLPPLPPSCYVLKGKKQVQMQKLLPRCLCAVHHASSVFTSFVLAAGIPHVPIVLGLDQPFWGHKLTELGVASSIIPHKELSEESLSQALNYACQPHVRERAREAKELLQLEGDPMHRIIEAFLTELSSLSYVSLEHGKPILVKAATSVASPPQ